VKENFLKNVNLTALSPPTIWRWLRICGFNDLHEKPEVRKYGMAFVDRYLKYERRCYRWIQIPLEEAKLLWESGDLIHESGYHYKVDDKKFDIMSTTTTRSRPVSTRFVIAWVAT
jgi:hypothetical protein